jgi:hypothetical protein
MLGIQNYLAMKLNFAYRCLVSLLAVPLSFWRFSELFIPSEPSYISYWYYNVLFYA